MLKSVTNPFFNANFLKFIDEPKVMGDFKLPNFDISALMQMQRKNIEMITALNQTAVENLQTFLQSQMKLMEEGFEQTTSLVNEAMSPQKAETEEDAPRQARTSEMVR